jgi:hypothetical protein
LAAGRRLALAYLLLRSMASISRPERSARSDWAFAPLGRSAADLNNGRGRDPAFVSVSAHELSCRMSEFGQQGVGLLQVGGVEALGEPFVDGCEQRSRLIPLALDAPKSCDAHCRA